jgi:hypothetical protein
MSNPASNPALSLYQTWDSLMQSFMEQPTSQIRAPSPTDRWNSTSFQFPTFDWGNGGYRLRTGVGIVGHFIGPIYGFGWHWGQYVTPLVLIRANGDFTFRHPTGGRHRDAMARGTFLDWCWVGGRMHWFVNPKFIPTIPPGCGDGSDWMRPTAFAPRLLGSYSHAAGAAWLRLRETERGWRIEASQTQENYRTHDGFDVYHAACAAIAECDRQQAARRARGEKRWRRSRGLSPQTSKPAILRSSNQMLTGVDAVRALAVLIDVNQPARRNTPLVRQRPAEARKGNTDGDA